MTLFCTYQPEPQTLLFSEEPLYLKGGGTTI